MSSSLTEETSVLGSLDVIGLKPLSGLEAVGAALEFGSMIDGLWPSNAEPIAGAADFLISRSSSTIAEGLTIPPYAEECQG